MLDFKKIAAEYPFRTELHAHTFPVSPCSSVFAADMVQNYLAAGCHTLAITNHLNSKYLTENIAKAAEIYLSDYYAALEAAKGTDLNVVLGTEIRFPKSEEFLVYGISPEDIEYFISLLPDGIENFYKKVKNDRNLILQAHPFRKDIVLAPTDAIDGIEVFNLHPTQHSATAYAAQYAKKHNMIISGGSDCHIKSATALCLLCTQTRIRDSYDIADALKSKQYVFDCSGYFIIP